MVGNTISQKTVKVHQDVEEAPSGYAEKVIQKTRGEIHTFLGGCPRIELFEK